TSGTVPMAGTIVRKGIYDAFMRGPEHVVELFHGYTYSAHPLACAAGLATLDLYRDEDLFARAKKLEPVWADAAMGLKGLPNVLARRPAPRLGRHPRGYRPRLAAGERRQARLRRHGARLQRGEPGGPRHRRAPGAPPAADRGRAGDWRDFRQGRGGDQSGELG